MAPTRKKPRVSLPLLAATKSMVFNAVESVASTCYQYIDSSRTLPLDSITLPGRLPCESFTEHVARVVDATRAAISSLHVVMFKIDLVETPVNDPVAAAALLSATCGQTNIADERVCRTVPLLVVDTASMPDTACRSVYGSRQYAEALVHSARAHFAFVEFDRRLIGTRSVGMSSAAISRLPAASGEIPTEVVIYTFIYTDGVNEPSRAVQTTTDQRRKSCFYDNRSGPDYTDTQLQETIDSLDRAEAQLTDDSMEVDDPASGVVTLSPDLTGARSPRKRRKLIAAVDDTRNASATTTTPVHSSSRKRPASRRAAVQPAVDQNTDQCDRRPEEHPLSKEQTPSARVRLVKTASPAKSAKRRGQLPVDLSPEQVDALIAFYSKLNGSQSEQSRIALTGRYARLTCRKEVPAHTIFQLLDKYHVRETPCKSTQETLPSLSAEQQREVTMQVFRQLSAEESEQSRVAFALRFMHVQHGVRIDSKTMFSWLKSDAKKTK